MWFWIHIVVRPLRTIPRSMPGDGFVCVPVVLLGTLFLAFVEAPVTPLARTYLFLMYNQPNLA